MMPARLQALRHAVRKSRKACLGLRDDLTALLFERTRPLRLDDQHRAQRTRYSQVSIRGL
jgi:hypothetical protein